MSTHNLSLFVIPADRPGMIYEQMLQGDASSHVIDSLEEDKTYTVSIYAIYPEGPSETVSVIGRTCTNSFFVSYFCLYPSSIPASQSFNKYPHLCHY